MLIDKTIAEYRPGDAYVSHKDDFRDDLRSAIVFRVENVAKYMEEVNGEGIACPNIAPAFPVMWMEYESWAGSDPNPVGVLIRSYEVEIEGRRTQNGPPERSRWHMFFSTFVEDRGDGRSRAFGTQGITVASDGAMLWPSWGLRMQLSEWASRRCSPMGEEGDGSFALARSVVPCLLALSFMHCRNVNIVDRVPRASMRHGGKGHGRIYKTLEIEPMRRILNGEGQARTRGLPHALHICRGHFKDYKDGGGLFGKLHGMYWWGDTLRGSRTMGEVVKDYNVHALETGNDPGLS